MNINCRVPSENPLFLSLIKALMTFSLDDTRNLAGWARGLARIKTLACGAGDPGFKSPRARHPRSAFVPLLLRVSAALRTC
jgi:hypothetical protein